MTLHRFGRIETPTATASTAEVSCNIDVITQTIIDSINQQGISEAVKSSLQTFSANIDKVIIERTQTLQSALGEVKNLSDTFSTQLVSIDKNKVDKSYLDEKLKAISDKIKNLEILDRNYLNTKLKQLSTEIFTKVNETQPSVIDNKYLDTVLEKLTSKNITKEEFEKRLSGMADAIKATIFDGIKQFVTKDAVNGLIKQITEQYAQKTDLKDFIKKDELDLAVKKVNDELTTLITNSEKDTVMRLQCSPAFIDYLKLFIHKMAYDIVRNYAKVSFNMNWIEAKQHNLTEEQVGDLITSKMGLGQYAGFVLAPKENL
jgi:hypothetical protein